MNKDRRQENKAWFHEHLLEFQKIADIEVLGIDGIHYRVHFGEGLSFDYWPSTLRHKDNQSGKKGNLTQPSEFKNLVKMMRAKDYGSKGASPKCTKNNPTGLPKRMKINGRVYWAEDWLIEQGKLVKPKGHVGPPMVPEEFNVIDDEDV